MFRMVSLSLPILFIFNILKPGIIAEDFLLDKCKTNDVLALKLLCRTFLELGIGIEDSEIQKQYEHYAYSQLERMNQQKPIQYLDIEKFAKMLIKNFQLSSLTIFSASFEHSTIKNILKDSSCKVQLVLEHQLKGQDLNNFKSDGYLVLNIENTNEFLPKLIQIHPYQFWFINDKEKDIIEEIKDMPVNSNFYVWTSLNAFSEMQIFKAFKIDNLTTEYLLWGLWNNYETLTAPGYQMEKSIDLKNMTIRVTAMTSQPYIYVSDSHELSGFYYDIWLSLEKRMGFITEFIKPVDKYWHGYDSNGSLIGLTGMVYHGRADVILVDMFLNQERAQFVDHTIVINYGVSKLFFKAPSGSDVNWSTFTDMFNGSVWIIMAITILFIALILHLLFDLWESKSRMQLGLIPFTCISILFNQGSPSEVSPKMTSGRVVLLTFLLIGMVLNASFSANLISTLSTKPINYPFLDIVSLYEQSNFKLVVARGTSFDGHFKNEHSVTGALMKNGRVEYKSTYQEMIDELLASNDKAALASESYFKSLVKDPCQFKSVPYGKTLSTLYMKKNFQFIPLFNYHIQLMAESGELDKLWNKWKPEEESCFTQTSEPVQIQSLVSGFVMLLMSIGLSMMFLILEIMWKKCSETQ